MLSRLLVVAVLALGGRALAQETPPPLIPVEGEPVTDGQPQYQQPYGQQPQYQQPYGQQPQYQQPYGQQPQYQQPSEQQPAPQQPPSATQPAREKSAHFVGLLAGSVGIAPDVSGFIGTARAELDLTRFALFFNYNSFVSTAFTAAQVNQFSAMGGWVAVSEPALRLRLLGGLDVMSKDGVVGLGPVVGANARVTFGRMGLDAAAFLTPLPFRQLELRAGLVVTLSIFELHLGWRFQVVDATADGSFERLFNLSPAVNGPSAGIGIAL